MSTEFDNVLSGVIVLLLIIVIYKWYVSRTSCGNQSGRLLCGCRRGYCKCGRRPRMAGGCEIKCRGGYRCSCGCPPNRCRCSMGCVCRQSNREGLADPSAEARVTSSAPYDISGTQDYAEATKKMSLEQDVSDSHQKWCDALTFNGLSTGASACTTLEETGRSYGTSDFVGLTARKWCKARQLATPAPDSRIIPSQENMEYCNVQMDELI
jgi:hypothetical protein